ncbi:MAG: response regulator [Candidatus Omnitrophica bacterium]|nr:response regulator [Candidatus Omnitrophota bacterium]MDD5437320.1 response regulator [Candidatus Omnitrophota bacterium]
MAKKVLVVDDEPYMLEILKTRLESSGYGVITAVNGEDCLKKAADVIPDLILMDILLPGMSGFEVAKRLKENDLTKDIPIIMVTALMGEDAVAKGLKSGATYFISKPFDSQELLDEIKKSLKEGK